LPVTAVRFAELSISAALIVGALVGIGGDAVASASSVPSPKLAKFIPANYRVTAVKKVNLDGSRVPQEAVTAVGPVNSSGFATSLVLVLAWDSYVERWTSVYDTLNQPSWQTSSQLGKGPGLINLVDSGRQVKVIHDQPHGQSDLLYWLNSIAGNTNFLIVGVVHFKDQIATQEYSFGQSYGHIESMDQPSHATIGASVIGDKPHQQVRISLPWMTPDDSESQGARMYYLTVAPIKNSFDEYEIAYNDQSYLGVGLSTNVSSNPSTVEYVDPQSPANGKLHVGEVIESVVGSTLSTEDAAYLLGPKIIEEVSLYQPGSVIKLNVLRNGQPITLTLKLAQWPIYQPSGVITTSTGTYYLM
jgi:hypothetical protein